MLLFLLFLRLSEGLTLPDLPSVDFSVSISLVNPLELELEEVLYDLPTTSQKIQKSWIRRQFHSVNRKILAYELPQSTNPFVHRLVTVRVRISRKICYISNIIVIEFEGA